MGASLEKTSLEDARLSPGPVRSRQIWVKCKGHTRPQPKNSQKESHLIPVWKGLLKEHFILLFSSETNIHPRE